MNAYNLILEDLKILPLTRITPMPSLHIYGDSPDNKLSILQRQIRRSKSTSNRKELLVNLFHLAELIDIQLTPDEREKILKKVSRYYLSLSRKVYYIFEPLGIEQIYLSRDTTTTMISNLKKNQYADLIKESITIAGARLEEEEVVDP